MQKTIWTYLLITFGIFTISSCDNELTIAADWKEIAVVYGALNPEQPINYIRIQRAYLDEKQGAFSFSSSPDSLYFDELIVRIDEFENDVFKQSFSLKKINGNDINLPKDTGIFYSDSNILYELANPVKISTNSKDYRYDIYITNPNTGYQCRASSHSVGKPEVFNPINQSTTSIRITDGENAIIPVRFLEGRHARTYSLVMDIRVEEFKKDSPSDKEIKNISWKMINSGKTRSLDGLNLAEYSVASVNFFATLSSVLKEDPNISRRLLDMDLTFYGISDEFNTYLTVNKPSIGIIQKKPEYTNLINGLGIFTSRHIREYKGITFRAGMIDQLQASEFTEKLGFVN